MYVCRSKRKMIIKIIIDHADLSLSMFKLAQTFDIHEGKLV